MSKLKNEVGNTYHYLTVLERAENDSNGRARWKCQCKCGNITIVKGSSLRNGSIKSCGCYQKEQTIKACSIDQAGKTIGNFTLLEKIPGKDGTRLKWRCRCNLCGNENAIIATSNLAIQESCGCLSKSKGQRKIEEILTINNITFITEKRFSDCRFENNRQARYDFYLPDYNCLIEYDGRQHYKQGNGVFDNQEKFQLTQQHDNYKNIYAIQNNISLIRIPYTHLEKIVLSDLLPESSSFLVRESS